MFKSKIQKYLNFLKGKTILITTHELADLDGVSSSIALNFFLKKLVNNLKILIYFSGISKRTELFLERLKQKFPDFNPIFADSFENADIDTFFILDTNKLENVDEFLSLTQFQREKCRFFFIDHHFSDRKTINSKENIEGIFLDEYSSTCEILVDLFEEFNVSYTDPIRFLLIAGIITDTGYFKFANNHTIQALANLLYDNIDYQELRLMLKTEPDISEKIARIKGTQRAKMVKFKKWLIGISHVSSFEASVANILIKVGFDVAMVISEREDENRVSIRAKKRICRKTGLHLGKLLESISKEFKANGGGHDGAASINIAKEEGILKDVILDKIKENLSKQ